MEYNTRTYFIERVLHSYKIFVDYHNSRKFGLHRDMFNAGDVAESLRDIPEHIFIEIGVKTGHQTPEAFRDSFTGNYNYYKIVCDLANVIKHRKITRKNPTFSSLDSVKDCVALIRYEDIEGRYYKSRKLLEVTLLDGSIYDVGELLHQSVILWSIELISLGLIPSMPKLPELLPIFAQRNDSRFDGDIQAFGYAGEPMGFPTRDLIHIKSKNTLTDKKLDEKFEMTLKYIAEIAESPFEE